MPFQKYLQPLQDVHDEPDSYHSYLQRGNDLRPTPIIDPSIFQWPSFMYNGLPTLPLGAGVDALPPCSLASPWFSNSGFIPKPYASAGDMLDFPHSLPQSTNCLGPAIPLADNDSPVIVMNDDVPFALTASGSNPFDPPPEMPPPINDLVLTRPISPSRSLLPYSTSGFDLLPILAQVASRPNPKIFLGPVDMTCSFVVVDAGRDDSPVVYCSPTFCQLTGYEEYEILGRNCRFLQAPGGLVEKGSHRKHSADAIALLKKSLMANEECQTTVLNYKKNGEPFLNLVTVIPVTGGAANAHGANEVVYHVGFQVERPQAITEKLSGSSRQVNVNYCAANFPLTVCSPTRKLQALNPAPISNVLRSLLMQPRFLRSLPISSSTTVPCSASEKMETPQANQILSLILLESLPDFIHVVSLKGSFLYVAPAVRHVLGYEPDELVGKSIADFCHKADVIPLMRELKDSSVTPSHVQSQQATPPKSVDMLFRARTKEGDYVWVESRGRLHVEPGKGRKAIILSGRARKMPYLKWEYIARSGGLTPSVPAAGSAGTRGSQQIEREFWAMLSADGTFLVVGAGVRDVLGWEVVDIMGKEISFLVRGNNNFGQKLWVELVRASEQGSYATSQPLSLRTKNGSHVSGQVVLYPSFDRPPCQVICQIRLPNSLTHAPQPVQFAPAPSANVFEELETSRGSSWQYELEKLRFDNQRLADEIDALEKKLGIVSPTPTCVDQRCQPLHIRHAHLDNPSMFSRISPSLKRTWDSRDVGPT